MVATAELDVVSFYDRSHDLFVWDIWAHFHVGKYVLQRSLGNGIPKYPNPFWLYFISGKTPMIRHGTDRHGLTSYGPNHLMFAPCRTSPTLQGSDRFHESASIGPGP